MLTARFIYREIPGGKETPDTTAVISRETAADEIKEICEEYSEIEKFRYGKKAKCREFIRIEEIEEDE